MSEGEADEELEALREQKLEELRREVADDGPGDGDQAAAGQAAPDAPVHVEGPDHYHTLLDRHDVVLVDFYADWCGPCRMLEPVVEDLAAETDAAVLKVDIDAHQGLAREMGVRSVPTLFVYSGGEVAEQVVGVKEKGELASMIRAAA